MRLSTPRFQVQNIEHGKEPKFQGVLFQPHKEPNILHLFSDTFHFITEKTKLSCPLNITKWFGFSTWIQLLFRNVPGYSSVKCPRAVCTRPSKLQSSLRCHQTKIQVKPFGNQVSNKMSEGFQVRGRNNSHVMRFKQESVDLCTFS